MPLLKAWYLQDEELHVVSCGTHDQLENGNTAPSAAFRGFGKVIMPWAATCVGAAMATSASERIILRSCGGAHRGTIQSPALSPGVLLLGTPRQLRIS